MDTLPQFRHGDGEKMEKTRILIVDDEELFAKILCVGLEEQGAYLCHHVTDPLQAIETARAFQPDLMILDLIMPGLDGGELRKLLKHDPDLHHIPTMLLTASANWTSSMEIETGGDILLSKPVSLEKLTRYIDLIMAEVRTTGGWRAN